MRNAKITIGVVKSARDLKWFFENFSHTCPKSVTRCSQSKILGSGSLTKLLVWEGAGARKMF